MKKLAQIFCLAIAALSLCSCTDKPEVMLTFHVCSPRTAMVGGNMQTVKMPITGFEVKMQSDYFMYLSDLVNVDVAEVYDQFGNPIRGLLFTTDSRGSRRLYQATAGNQGAQIVLMEGSTPVALRKIDVVMSDGNLFMLTEFPEGVDIFEKAETYKKSINAAQAIKNRM